MQMADPSLVKTVHKVQFSVSGNYLKLLYT